MHGITELEDGGLRLGALATNASPAHDERVASRYPALSRAILAGASAQLRNAATNGGDLNQRKRCHHPPSHEFEALVSPYRALMEQV